MFSLSKIFLFYTFCHKLINIHNKVVNNLFYKYLLNFYIYSRLRFLYNLSLFKWDIAESKWRVIQTQTDHCRVAHYLSIASRFNQSRSNKTSAKDEYTVRLKYIYRVADCSKDFRRHSKS